MHRLVLFGLAQALIAAGYAVSGEPSPWSASVGWWPITATVTNLLSLTMLSRWRKRIGESWGRFYNVEIKREFVGRDLLFLLGVVIVSAPIAYIPNIGLAHLLFGDPETPLNMFVQAIPSGAAWIGLVLFPITIALAELPVYYRWALPRLVAAGRSGGQALFIAALWHAAQHITLPLVFDVRFMLWRFGMFLPFALLVGAVIQRRPRLLPYLMVVHGIIDLQVAWMVWHISI